MFDKLLNHLLDQKEEEFKLGKLKREFFLMRDLRETGGIPILSFEDALMDIADLTRQGYFSQHTLKRFVSTDAVVRWEVYKSLLKELNKKGIRTARQKEQHFRLNFWIIILLIWGISLAWFFLF